MQSFNNVDEMQLPIQVLEGLISLIVDISSALDILEQKKLLRRGFLRQDRKEGELEGEVLVEVMRVEATSVKYLLNKLANAKGSS